MDILLKSEICIKENDEIIEQFHQSLVDQNLSPKTTRLHVNNVEFFLNTYVARYEGKNYLEADQYIDDFLGYFFIHKCMWSTPSSIKTYITSLKKFYAFLLTKQLIDKDKYVEVVAFMKDNKEWWMEDCANFNDPEYDYFGDYF